MSSLTEIEKRYLEKVLRMSDDYVLDFSNGSFGEFFMRHGIDIHGKKYQVFGTSKAKKLRAFRTSYPNRKVGEVLSEMLDSYEDNCDLSDTEPNRKLLEKVREIAGRLIGQAITSYSARVEKEFLARKYRIKNIRNLPIDYTVVPVVEAWLEESRIALVAGAHLSVIFLCGSVLEAVLLGAAQQKPTIFNRSGSTPRKLVGSPKRFQYWSLSESIDTAYEIGFLKPDLKKFSHGLREFRTYIHPYAQLASGFIPDQHTAKVCFQILNAAPASVAEERR